MATKPTKKLTEAPAPVSVPEPKKEVCFVIMPFGGWLDDYYLSVYCPAIIAAGLEPHRADDLFRPSTIVNDIWAYTKRAKVLLADLTGKNPNVFYELGLAHALAKPAILIAESMDDIPFDLRALRIILYDKNAPDWGRILKEKIETSMKEVLASPVEAVLPAFLDVKAAGAKPSVSAEQKDVIEIKQELELLRREIRSQNIEARPVKMRSDIGPDDARSLVRSMVERDVPDEVILRKLEQLGPPMEWLTREIMRARIELTSKPTRLVSSKVKARVTKKPTTKPVKPAVRKR